MPAASPSFETKRNFPSRIDHNKRAPALLEQPGAWPLSEVATVDEPTLHEEWRPVVGYEALYEVSNLGRVRSLPKPVRGGYYPYVRKGRILRSSSDSSGYLPVSLYDQDGKRKVRRIHALVAEAFIGPRPRGYDVRHMDGDRTNNKLSNLAYGTRSENFLDMRRHGTHRNGSKTHCKHGHEFTPENTYIRREGGRKCRTCTLSRGKKAHADR